MLHDEMALLWCYETIFAKAPLGINLNCILLE